MSDTPRSDFFEEQGHGMYEAFTFARMLERELAAMTEERDALLVTTSDLQKSNTNLCRDWADDHTHGQATVLARDPRANVEGDEYAAVDICDLFDLLAKMHDALRAENERLLKEADASMSRLIVEKDELENENEKQRHAITENCELRKEIERLKEDSISCAECGGFHDIEKRERRRELLEMVAVMRRCEKVDLSKCGDGGDKLAYEKEFVKKAKRQIAAVDAVLKEDE